MSMHRSFIIVAAGWYPPCLNVFKEILKDYRKSLDALLGDEISAQTKKNLVSWACKRVAQVQGYSVKWCRMGFPDFLSAGAVFNIAGKIANFDISQITHNGVVGMNGNDSNDYRKAADKMKELLSSEISNGSVVVGSDNKVTINGQKYTWHHHQDGRHMQLVRSDIHRKCGNHLGGRKLAKEGLIGRFASPTLTPLLKCN